MSTYYDILGVHKTSTQDEIKQAYKKLAKVHHPDKGGNTELFQKIQTAYETLGDEQKKNEYDNPVQNIFGGGGFPSGGMSGGFHPFNFSDLDSIFRTNRKTKIFRKFK